MIRRDAEIKAFQADVGIEPASGETDSILGRIQHTSCELIRVVERERAGIRDGDGGWSGTDPVGGLLHELRELHRALDAAEQLPPEQQADSVGEPIIF